MKSVVGHAVFLALALGAAAFVWSREGETSAAPGSVVLWEGQPQQVAAVLYESGRNRTELERRSDSLGTFLWGRVTAAPPATPVPATPATDSTTVTQFLVGEQGEEAVRSLAALRATRDLGVPDADREREYGLAGTTAGRLRVEEDGHTHELTVGGSVFGSGDRYVQDVASRRAYVVPSTLLVALDAGAGSLGERRLHGFAPDEVNEVVVRAAGGQRAMRRVSAPGTAEAWAPPNALDRTDQTFGTFMDRVAQLWADRYEPDVDRSALREVLRIDYAGARGQPLGYLSLLSSGGGKPEYWFVTEHTRTPVRAYAGAAESIARDAEQLFGEGPLKS